MTKEDINFLISIQSLPDEEFQIAYLERELDKKENIIKEVRKYIEKEYVQVKNKEYNLSWNNLEYIIKEILEILDKGE